MRNDDDRPRSGRPREGDVGEHIDMGSPAAIYRVCVSNGLEISRRTIDYLVGSAYFDRIHAPVHRDDVPALVEQALAYKRRLGNARRVAYLNPTGEGVPPAIPFSTTPFTWPAPAAAPKRSRRRR